MPKFNPEKMVVRYPMTPDEFKILLRDIHPSGKVLIDAGWDLLEVAKQLIEFLEKHPETQQIKKLKYQWNFYKEHGRFELATCIEYNWKNIHQKQHSATNIDKFCSLCEEEFTKGD